MFSSHGKFQQAYSAPKSEVKVKTLGREWILDYFFLFESLTFFSL
jgi:hypothetical protein